MIKKILNSFTENLFLIKHKFDFTLPSLSYLLFFPIVSIKSITLFDMLKRIYFDGFSFIYPNTWSVLRWLENRDFSWLFQLFWDGHGAKFSPSSLFINEFSFVYFSLIFLFFGWLDVYLTPLLKEKYPKYDEWMGICYSVNPKEFFLGSGLDSVLNMEVDRHALQVLVKKTKNEEHRKTFLDQFININEEFLDRMDEISLDFNYFFFTLYNEYTMTEQDMDWIFVGIFFPFGFIASWHIFGRPIGMNLAKIQRLYIASENIKIVSGGDLHMFSEMFNRASFLFLDVFNNYVFTNLWDSEQNDYDKLYYYNLYWEDMLLEIEPYSFVNKIFHEPDIPELIFDSPDAELLNRQMEFPLYKYFREHQRGPPHSSKLSGLYLMGPSKIAFGEHFKERWADPSKQAKAYERYLIENKYNINLLRKGTYRWHRQAPSTYHLGDYFFDTYVVDTLTSHRQKRTLTLSPGHLSPYAFYPRWTHFGNLYTYLNPNSSVFYSSYIENKFQTDIWEHLNETVSAAIATNIEINELLVDLQIEQIKPSYYGGEYHDNITLEGIWDDYWSSRVCTSVWDFSNLLTHEGRIHVSLDGHAEIPMNREIFPLKISKIIYDMKKQLRTYVFLQTYVDLLQSKYGPLLGQYMFSSVGNSIDFYVHSLKSLSIDWDWYELTHYIYFPDLTFDNNQVKDLQLDYFGTTLGNYSFFDKEQYNELSSESFPIDLVSSDNMALHWDDEQQAKDLGENITWGLYFDEEYYFDNEPTFPGFYKSSFSFSSKNIDYATRFWKVLNLLHPNASKNYLLYNLTFDAVSLYLSQKVLYPFFLQSPVLNYKPMASYAEDPFFLSNATKIYHHSTFFPLYKKFLSYLIIPDFQKESAMYVPYMKSSWSNERYTPFINFTFVDMREPFESFDGHFLFKNLDRYNYFNVFWEDYATKYIFEENYIEEYPSYEDFVGQLNLEWVNWRPLIETFWPWSSLVDTVFDQEITPFYFEDFSTGLNTDAAWYVLIQKWNAYMESEYKKWAPVYYKEALRLFKGQFFTPEKFEINELHPEVIQREDHYYDLFFEIWENYMHDPDVVYDLLDKKIFRLFEPDLMYPQEGIDYTEESFTWTHWDDEESILPYMRYQEPYLNKLSNDAYPFEPHEWVRFTYSEPFLLQYSSGDIMTYDDEPLTLNIYDEPSVQPDYSKYEDVSLTLQNNQEYKDEDIDTTDYTDIDDYLEEDIVGWYNFELANEFFSHSIKLKDLDWITRFAVWSTGVSSDENGVFHLNMVDVDTSADSIYFLPEEEFEESPVFWSEEDFEESIFNSYYLPFAEKKPSLLKFREVVFVMSPFGAYKVGLDFEDLSYLEDDISEYDDDGDLLDWYHDNDPRYGSVWPRISMDGDLNSFGKPFFESAGFWDDTDDLEPYEVDFSDPDDMYITDPVYDTMQTSYLGVFPGHAIYFLPEVFPTVAWHGYPIPIDAKGWVNLNWFWRICSLDDISYSWNYLGTTHPLLLGADIDSTFHSFFADSLGIFNQEFTGEYYFPSHHQWMADTETIYWPQDKTEGLGYDLTHDFSDRLLPVDVEVMDGQEYDDMLVNDEQWDDEEMDEDIEEEDGEEFVLDDAGVEGEIFLAGQEEAEEESLFDPLSILTIQEQAYEEEDEEVAIFDLEEYTEDIYTFNKGLFYNNTKYFKNCIDNSFTPWYIETRKFPLNFIDYFNLTKYEPTIFNSRKEWWLVQKKSQYWTPMTLQSPYEFKSDKDIFLERWYRLGVWYGAQQARKYPHQYPWKVYPFLFTHYSMPTVDNIDYRFLTKEQWYKYFSETADSQFENPLSFVWNRYSLLRTMGTIPLAKKYSGLWEQGFILNNLPYVEKFNMFSCLKKENFESLDLGNKYEKIKEQLDIYFKKEDHMHGHMIKLPHSTKISLNYKEEDSFVLRFISDAVMEWEDLYRHSYFKDDDLLNAINLVTHILKDGYLQCVIRYNFNVERLDTFLYNDYLCMDSNVLYPNIKDPAFIKEYLSPSNWYSTFERFFYLRISFFILSYSTMTSEELLNYARWFYWHATIDDFDSRLSFFFFKGTHQISFLDYVSMYMEPLLKFGGLLSKCFDSMFI